MKQVIIGVSFRVWHGHFDEDRSIRSCAWDRLVREASSPEGLRAFAADLASRKAEVAKHPCIERRKILTL
jgi:hypothetical protein